MKRLMRVWYRTDSAPNVRDSPNEEYVGTFSDPFPQNPAWQIVDVDWSPPGEVQITYLIPADHL